MNKTKKPLPINGFKFEPDYSKSCYDDLDLSALDRNPECCDLCRHRLNIYEEKYNHMTFCNMQKKAMDKKDVCFFFSYSNMELLLTHEKKMFLESRKPKNAQLELF